MEYKLSNKDYKIKIRFYIVFIFMIIILITQFLEIENRFSILLTILGILLTSATFFEPLINPIISFFFKEEILINRMDIYENVIRQILTAEQKIRFKTPTTTWGLYSQGLKIFDETLEAIKNVTSRGVEVQIIADIWDWERAKFAKVLKSAGANIVYNSTVHDYYLIQDETSLLTMGTETKSQRINMLDRNIRRLSERATLSFKKANIAKAILIFDEEWSKINPIDFDNKIKEFDMTECPHCNAKSNILFSDMKIMLSK